MRRTIQQLRELAELAIDRASDPNADEKCMMMALAAVEAVRRAENSDYDNGVEPDMGYYVSEPAQAEERVEEQAEIYKKLIRLMTGDIAAVGESS